MADMTRDEDKKLRARAICKDDYDIEGVKWACEGGCIHPAAGSVCPYRSAAEATMKAEADAGLAVVQCIPTDEMVNAGIAGAKTAGYTVHPDAAHFVLNAGNKAGDLMGDGT